ncbi:AAA family ATPase [Helcobacillus massiliensis]|uniref:MoxR-like ATPase n=1 Tax=Helcobacillus massiliensis TaxID=521392 RepID=A0A839QVV0_9MICO|nr:MoxR family ATPase [Helcobacillus massiliensis]MBB3022131.1 MoxR-like ATPase [Helcobacillus massiliensis]
MSTPDPQQQPWDRPRTGRRRQEAPAQQAPSQQAAPQQDPSAPARRTAAPDRTAQGRPFEPVERALSAAEQNRADDVIERISATFRSRVVGQERLRLALVASLAAGGHILLESVPGLAKTTAAQALATAIGGSFARIQCTPDLMPNDILGTQIYNYGTGEFTTQLGPVHANIVLLDEINRSSAKTQSAMLEAMQERQTSIGGELFRLPDPFMVLATQNPIEEEGTYVLPEAQMDRFLLKEILTYPSPRDEHAILDRSTSGELTAPRAAAPTVSLEDIRFLQSAVDRVYVDPAIKRYIIDLIFTTRGTGPRPIENLTQSVRVGASPRGSLALMRVGQAHALLHGRDFVTPEDVRALAHSVLRHRLVLTFDAIAAGMSTESIIDAVFAAVPQP